ncbi:hypothetical protein BC828DRAFT_408757, partial [Blastocladiella britannica]
MKNLPKLVLDLILCHAIGDQKSRTGVPDAFVAYLMVAPPALVPRFLRKLLRQTSSFSITATESHTPTLALACAWTTVYSVSELELDFSPLSVAAFNSGQIDLYDWLCDTIRPPVVITAAMVDAASCVGAPMVDRLWQQHCDTLPPNEFPYSAKAVDNTTDVATLDWWWQKHVQLGLPFKYTEAVHSAFTARLPREQYTWFVSSGPCPNHLAMCRWWRDRATLDGLQLQISFVDTAASYSSDRGSLDREFGEEEEFHVMMREFDIEDLVRLGEHGLLGTMQLWEEMVDAGLLPPVSMEVMYYHGDPLLRCRLLDAHVLGWWLQRHQSHGLAFPPILESLATATKLARTDTLDWIWQASDTGRVQFTVPGRVEVSRETYVHAMDWWMAMHAKHGIAMPSFDWAPSSIDTRADLQAFWDPKKRDPSVQILFTSHFTTTDADLLAWLVDHGGYTGEHGIRTNFPSSLECMWKQRNFDGLDLLLDYSQNDTTCMTLKFEIRRFLVQAASQGDTAVLRVWYNHPALRRDVESDLANWVLLPALAGGHVEFASLWLQYMHEFKYELSLPVLVTHLCQVWKDKDMSGMPAGLSWIVQRFGPTEIPDRTMEYLLADSDLFEYMRFLEWLAVEGLARGVIIPGFNEEAREAQWELICRLVAELGRFKLPESAMAPFFVTIQRFQNRQILDRLAVSGPGIEGTVSRLESAHHRTERDQLRRTARMEMELTTTAAAAAAPASPRSSPHLDGGDDKDAQLHMAPPQTTTERNGHAAATTAAAAAKSTDGLLSDVHGQEEDNDEHGQSATREQHRHGRPPSPPPPPPLLPPPPRHETAATRAGLGLTSAQAKRRFMAAAHDAYRRAEERAWGTGTSWRTFLLRADVALAATYIGVLIAFLVVLAAWSPNVNMGDDATVTRGGTIAELALMAAAVAWNAVLFYSQLEAPTRQVLIRARAVLDQLPFTSVAAIHDLKLPSVPTAPVCQVVRDGATARPLPAALLVAGDVIEMHYGDIAPAACRYIPPPPLVPHFGPSPGGASAHSVPMPSSPTLASPPPPLSPTSPTFAPPAAVTHRDHHPVPEIRLQAGQGLRPTHFATAAERADAARSRGRFQFEVLEAPVAAILDALVQPRPRTVMTNQLQRLQALLQRAAAAVYVLALAIALVRGLVVGHGGPVGPTVVGALLMASWTVLPLVPLAVPSMYLAFRSFGNAHVAVLWRGLQAATADYDDGEDEFDVEAPAPTIDVTLAKAEVLLQALRVDTSDLTESLASITVLSCVDRHGTLTDAFPTVDAIWFPDGTSMDLAPVPHATIARALALDAAAAAASQQQGPQDQPLQLFESDGNATAAAAAAVFEDRDWARHLPQLRPLGLAWLALSHCDGTRVDAAHRTRAPALALAHTKASRQTCQCHLSHLLGFSPPSHGHGSGSGGGGLPGGLVRVKEILAVAPFHPSLDEGSLAAAAAAAVEAAAAVAAGVVSSPSTDPLSLAPIGSDEKGLDENGGGIRTCGGSCVKLAVHAAPTTRSLTSLAALSNSAHRKPPSMTMSSVPHGVSGSISNGISGGASSSTPPPLGTAPLTAAATPPAAGDPFASSDVGSDSGGAAAPLSEHAGQMTITHHGDEEDEIVDAPGHDAGMAAAESAGLLEYDPYHAPADPSGPVVRVLPDPQFEVPFVHASLLQDPRSGAYQLISGGSVEAVLDVCTDAWMGDDIVALTAEQELAMIEWYWNTVMNDHEVMAYAYKPVLEPVKDLGTAHLVYAEIPPLPMTATLGAATATTTATAAATANGSEDEPIAFAADVPVPPPRLTASPSNDENPSHPLQEPPAPVAAAEEMVVASHPTTAESAARRKRTMSTTAAANAAAAAALSPPRRRSSAATIPRNDPSAPTVALLQTQILLGQVAFTLEPKEDVADAIEDVALAGIRFVYFSPSNERQTKAFGERLGLDTDWNSCILLSRPSDPYASPQYMERTDIKARLPRGVDAIRDHLRDVDDIPLHVSLFAESAPDAVLGMIRVFQEHGEVVCVLGSTLNPANAPIFRAADVAVGIHPIPVKPSAVVPVGGGVPGYGLPTASPGSSSTSATSPTQQQQQTTSPHGRSILPVTAAAQLVSLSCPLVMNAETSMFALTQLVREARRLCTSARMGLVLYAAATMSLAAVQLISLAALMPVWRGWIVTWLCWAVAPTLAAAYLTNPHEPDTMKQFTERNVEHVRDVVRFARYAAARLVVPVAVNAWLYAVAIQAAARSQGGSEEEGMSVVVNAPARLGAEVVGATVFVVHLVVASATFMHRTASVTDYVPFRNRLWCGMSAFVY